MSLGGNQYAESSASGVPQISAPGSTNHGKLQGSALENSNVDLTSQLVNLITAQRLPGERADDQDAAGRRPDDHQPVSADNGQPWTD